MLPSVRSHHAVRYACSQGTETSPRIIVRLVVFEPLTVTVTPNPLVRKRSSKIILFILMIHSVFLHAADIFQKNTF